jgi:hypothetical protein
VLVMLRRGPALWPRGHRDMFGTQLSFHQANMFLQDCGGQKRTNIGRCMYVTTVFCRSGRGSWQVHMVQQLPRHHVPIFLSHTGFAGHTVNCKQFSSSTGCVPEETL